MLLFLGLWATPVLVVSKSTALDFNEAWVWEGSAGLEFVTGGAIDADGSLVLVGSQGYEQIELDDDTFVDQTAGDFAAVKLQNSGEVLWSFTYSSSGSYYDEWRAVDTDSDNNVIIGGRTEGFWTESNPDEFPHFAVVKLDGSTGDELWRYQESPPDTTSFALIGGGYRYFGGGTVLGVAVDSSDDGIFLVGQVYGSLLNGEGDPGDSDAFVLKLDGTDGSEIWRLQVGDGAEFDSFIAAKTDSAGNVVVVGNSGQIDTMDFVVLKLSGTDGSTLWDYTPSSATSVDVLRSVDVDADGDVYVAGGLDAENLQGDIAETPFVLKLDGSTGRVLWAYEGVAPSRAVFGSVGVDPVTGVVVAAGLTEGTWVEGAEQGGNDFAAVVLDGSTGEELSRYQDGTSNNDALDFAGFDSEGGLLVGGDSAVGSQSDPMAIKFGASQEKGGLAGWEIAAIVCGVVLLLLLLMACARRHVRKKKDAQVQGSAGTQPQVETIVPKAVPAPVTRPPVQVEAVPATPPPVFLEGTPAATTTAKVVAMPGTPPPAYASPQPAVTSPPPQETNPTDVAPEAPAETAAQRLAKRKAPVPDSMQPALTYKDVPISMFKPFAPAQTKS